MPRSDDNPPPAMPPPLFRTPRPTPIPPRPDRGEWELALVGDLSEKQGEFIERLLDLPRRSRGLLWIDSGGGSVYVGLAIASILRLRGLRVTGIATGECSSASLLPFATCETRYVTPLTTLLFHPMRWQSEEDVRLEEAAEWARHFQELETDLDGLLTRLFDADPQLIASWTRPGRFVRGRELSEAGLAQIVDPFAGDFWSQR